MKRVCLAGLLMGVLALAGGARAADGPVPVLATVGMIGDLAATIGGDCAAVEVLIGAGSDPHIYQPRASDISRLQAARVVLYEGFNLEGRLGAVLDRLRRDRVVVAVGEEAVPADILLTSHGAVDPHLWMDVSIWARLVPVIADVLGGERPGCKADIAARAARLHSELSALHAWVRETLASIPEGHRVLVTAHDAFGYFARAYGLHQVAIQGFSTVSEASVADIRSVAAEVVTSGVPAVFVESTINPRTVQAMLEAVAAQGGQVGLGGQLYSDAMGQPGTAEGTYVGMIRANVRTIVAALGGTPAPWPQDLAGWAERNGVTP
ncbi:metal ABC transporter solute-binding protein, Zn/Mn family [Gemmobacter nectariphilus]|uniref:metal ABC transporter solute-binding protein, Zn/Mn family n=1 Tax=Gemmobacter nectariphilus TaxID=220343 RepID=UPI0004286A43|nr:zinc ABC transporter substrate-binding protein [Gemmobacter nectariphilus]